MFIILPTYAQTSSVKLISKLLRHISVSIHHLQGVYKLFDIHRAVHRNISVVKPTRCTSVSYLLYLGMTLCMFRTVFPSIISIAVFKHGPQGPGPRAANFQGRHIKKKSRLKYGMRGKKAVYKREI